MQTRQQPTFINLLNRQEIDDELKLAEGKARVRRVTVADIGKAISMITYAAAGELEDAMKFLIDIHAQHIPPNYIGDLKSTQVEVTHSGGEWYITKVMRTTASRHKVVLFNNPDNPKPGLDNRVKAIKL